MSAVPRVVDALRERLGPSAVVTDAAELDARSHDTWPVATMWAKLGRHPHRPEAVVHVSTSEEVADVLRIAYAVGVPVTPWGLGSSVTGQPLPVHGGLVLDLSGNIGEPLLNEVDRVVSVPSGVRGSDLEGWLQQRGLTLHHSPQSLGRSTVGGWVATRATGQFSSRYGGVEDLVTGYTVVLADGTVAEVGQRPRSAMGPDLKQIFIGSEGTLGVVTSVTMKVFQRPQACHLEAFTLPDVRSGIDAMKRITQSGLRPHLVRLYDEDEARHTLGSSQHSLPVIFVGHEGIGDVAAAEHRATIEILHDVGAASLGSDPVESWMERRFDFSTIENRLAEPGGYAETVEVANVWSRIGPMYDDLKGELAPLADEVLVHFSHIYDQGSSLYVILLGRAATDEQALHRLEEIWRRAMKVVLAHDGELSHHHGSGLARQPWVEESLGSGFEVLRRIKRALDQRNVLNPGKLGLDVLNQ